MASESSLIGASSSSAGESVRSKSVNGVVKTRVICPEMCCYCFDVLIGYIHGQKTTNSCMKKYFSNDE